MNRGHILVDHEIEAKLGSEVSVARDGVPITEAQVQPTSLDLRLARRAIRMRAGFLPSSASIEERLEVLGEEEFALDDAGHVFEKGSIYLVELEEEFRLDEETRGRCNPRSSTGRCDVFTRVVCPGHARFDATPAGYAGKLWLEVSPLSFDVRLRRGDRLAQIRLQRGTPALTTGELVSLYGESPLAFDDSGPLSPSDVRFDDEGGLLLTVGFENRSPVGWRARPTAPVLDFASDGEHSVRDYWEPVEAPRGHVVLEPGAFYVFASRERVAVPPDFAAEMLPVDVGIGELRNNYAGFFDAGFGWPLAEEAPSGTPAVLEVRARDVPFLIEDGQVFFRLRYFRTSGTPEHLYGEGRKSYRSQDLALARQFASP